MPPELATYFENATNQLQCIAGQFKLSGQPDVFLIGVAADQIKRQADLIMAWARRASRGQGSR